MRILVTGGAGFIGSHLTDKLIALGHEVAVVDNLQTGYREQVNPEAEFFQVDVTHPGRMATTFNLVKPEKVFHLAAIARTPWCIDDPILAGEVNSHGTLVVLEVARHHGVKRVVLASSNVIYAAYTPYRASKEMVILWARVYAEMYGQSVIPLVFSNVYGPRQSEEGPSPNVFAALRKCKREKGCLEITGDGEQSRDFTHVSDIVRGLIAASESDHCGPIDLCTGMNWSLNQVAAMFGGPVKYLPERPGDVKHIRQDPRDAERILGWKAKVALAEGIRDCLDKEGEWDTNRSQ